MAGGFTTLPQVIMSALGGVPVMPAGSQTIIEKLRAAKSMLPGDMGGIMGLILQDGPGALLQNPIGAITGQLQGQLGGLTSQIQGLAGGNLGGLGGLLSSITGAGGLQQALGSLGSVSGALSGLTQPLQGGFGLMDLVGHANIVSMLGSNMPAGLGLAQAAGPLMMGDRLTGMSTQVASIAAAIGAGTVDPTAAVARVTGMTGTINGVLDAHANAMGTVQDRVMSLAGGAAVVSLLVSGPAEFAPIADILIRDEHKPAIQAAVDEQIRPADLPGDPADWA